MNEVVLVPVFGIESSIHVIRTGAIDHDENEALRGICADIRVVGPIPETGATTVQQVDRGQSRAGGNIPRKIDPVRHVPVESR